MLLLLFSFLLHITKTRDISYFDRWRKDIAAKSITSIDHEKTQTVISNTVHSICDSDNYIYAGLNDGKLAVILKNKPIIKYHKIMELRAMNITDIVHIADHNMLFISGWSPFTHSYRISIIQYTHKLSTLTTLLSITLAPNINTITACFSSTKSQLMIIVSPSDIILSVSIDRITHKLSTSKIRLNYKFESHSLICIAFDGGYVVMMDNDCAKLVYIAEAFQMMDLVAGFTAYRIENVEYDRSRNHINSQAVKHYMHTHKNFIQQLPFKGKISTLLMSATCVIQLDLAILYSIDALIFSTDSLSSILMHDIIDIQTLIMHQTESQLGYLFVQNNTLYSVLADIDYDLSSIRSSPSYHSIHSSACDAIIIKHDIQCHINGYTYYIHSILGHGSHAVVWLASQHGINGTFIRYVALKIFGNQAPFDQELCAMQRVHLYNESVTVPHLISLIDVADKILVLQYIEGGDLASIMKQPRGVFVNMDRIDIIIQCLWQISHPLSIMNDRIYSIHSDLKPDNILVAQYLQLNDTLDVYISDLSCVLELDEFIAGSMGGTLLWLSPEMAESVYVSTPHNESAHAAFMCVDAYGLCLTVIHLYHSLCVHTNSTINNDILCNISNTFHTAMTEFAHSEKNFFTAAKALNKMIELRSNAMELALYDVLNGIGSHSQKMTNVVQLLSVFLLRNPRNMSPYPYITSTASQCTTWKQWRAQLQALLDV